MPAIEINMLGDVVAVTHPNPDTSLARINVRGPNETSAGVFVAPCASGNVHVDDVVTLTIHFDV